MSSARTVRYRSEAATPAVPVVGVVNAVDAIPVEQRHVLADRQFGDRAGSRVGVVGACAGVIE
jgi:hypothetical protein